ncbi:MAG TPA: hypothetical protein VEJ84_10450 [Acidimicrobiales bacterium]|nr:hypothetical protein [Acidimicrobiales bacterium]
MQQTPSRDPRRRRFEAGALFGLGAAGVVAFIAVQWLPLWDNLSTSQVNGLCQSTLGTIGQALDTRAALDCHAAQAATWFGWAGLVAGVALIIIGGLVRGSVTRRPAFNASKTVNVYAEPRGPGYSTDATAYQKWVRDHASED